MNERRHSDSTERSLIASVLVGGQEQWWALHELDYSSFYVQKHQEWWKKMSDLYRATGGVSIADLRDVSDDEKVELADITVESSSTPYVGNLVKIVRQDHQVRLAADIGWELASVGHEQPQEEVEAWLLTKAEDLSQVCSAYDSGRLVNSEEVASRIFRTMKGIYEEAHSVGISTGVQRLDAMIIGFSKPDYWIIAGRPSMGKSALAGQIAYHAAELGHKVLVATLEMTAEAMAFREACSRAEVSGHTIKSKKAAHWQINKVGEEVLKLSRLPILYEERPTLSIGQLRSQVLRERPALVVVDYLQLMKGEGQSLRERVTYISAGLKSIAKSGDVPVVALSQLSRSNEQSGGKYPRRPMPSDLKESGDLEAHADGIILIHRPGVYDKKKSAAVAELIVGKQRNGPTGIVYCGWQDAATRFTDTDTEHVEEEQREENNWKDY